MWVILCALSAVALGLGPVEFTPEEQEYFERFSNYRSACEVFCENVEQGVLECHKECFLTFCYKRPAPAAPTLSADSAPAAEPAAPVADPVIADPEAESLPATPVLFNLFSESISGFVETSGDDENGLIVEVAAHAGNNADVYEPDGDGDEMVEDKHAGHGHGYWPAS